MKILAILVAAFGLLVLAPTAGSAQTGYQLDNVSTNNPAPGQSMTVYANGFKPNSVATITLQSDPVLLATVNATANGVVSASVTIPANTPGGPHTIYVRGIDRNGAAKVVSFPITVGGSGGLPQTGVNIGLGLAVAAIAVGVGTTLFSATRRRTAPV